ELDDSHPNHNGKNVYRPDGLLKQSFSITTSDGKKLHLISYYTNEDVASKRLYETPSRDPRFVQIIIPKGIYPETSPHGDSSQSSASHSGSSPQQRSRPRPHHRAFQTQQGQQQQSQMNVEDTNMGLDGHRRPDGAVTGHRRTHSGSLSVRENHRYSPMNSNDSRYNHSSHGHSHGHSHSHSYSHSHSHSIESRSRSNSQ